MRIALLGPLSVVDNGGSTLHIGPPKERAVLAVLALRSPATASTSELIAALWGEAAPVAAKKALRNHVSRLRKTLGSSAIETSRGGYRLCVGAEDVDVVRFERRIREGASALDQGDASGAVVSLSAALDLWRGQPVGDLCGQPVGIAAADRLVELRRDAEERLADARLALGEHDSLIDDLEAATLAEPLRERRWAQLMLALYRSGRRGDALQAFQRLRRILADEIGVEPGESTCGLEAAILAQDPDLDLPDRHPAKSALPAAQVLPSGTVTFVFTDVERSTELFRKFGDRYPILLQEHRRIIRSAIHAAGGVEVSTEGDGFLIAFGSVISGLRACLDAQRELASHPWPADSPIRVRMGLSVGAAVPTPAGDYVAVAIHHASRVAAAGHGGQILLSEQATVMVRDTLPPEVSLEDLGRYRMAGFDQPERLFQAGHPDLESSFPPLRAAAAVPTNLPTQLSSFIGRDTETSEVEKLLLGPNRLVTLTGVGGVGKTRLAIHVASRLTSRFEDGLWFVDLARLSGSADVPAAIADVLGVRYGLDRPVGDVLEDFVRDRDLLLVLDNCEHLIDVVADVVRRLLEVDTKLRVLATSRERLRVPGEAVWPVGPLALPRLENTSEGVLGSESVRLFVERASDVNPSLTLDGHTVGAIGQIVTLLDGMPLAIELAAARANLLPPQEILDRLGDRFHLLTGGPRTALPRHQTLEAVVAWSYELLTPPEQRLFRRLSVFPDSFPLEGVESMATSPGLETIGHLVDKSLVVSFESNGTYRYRLLETLRQYGLARLVELDDADDAYQQLVRWVLVQVDRLEKDMRTHRQDAAILAVLLEQASARVALECVRNVGDNLAALRIVSAIPLMPTEQRRALLLGLLQASNDTPAQIRAQVLLTLANLSFDVGAWDDVLRFCREAAEIFERDGDERLAAWAKYFEVIALWGKPDERERARELSHATVDTFRTLQDDFGLAYALWAMAQFTEELQPADAYARESERLFRELGAPFGLAHALEGLALVSLRRGSDDEARRALTEALSIFAEAGNFGCTAHCLEATAAFLAQRGQIEDAAGLLGAADRLRDEVGQQLGAWELEGRARAEDELTRFSHVVVGEARARGRQLGLSGAVDLATQLLDGDALLKA